MSYDFEDPVALRHPALPGEIVVMSRLQLPALAEVGWVEAKSPEAKALIAGEAPSSSTGDKK